MNTITMKEKIVGTIATGALIFGTAYGAGTLQSPLGAPIMVASSLSIGLILGATMKKSKKEIATI